MADFVSIKELAARLQLDPTTVRRFIARVGPQLGIEVQTGRGSTRRWSRYVSREDADRLIAVYESQHSTSIMLATEDAVVPSSGFFYVIQLVPEALPNRVKIGYTDNLDKRLAEHQTAAPTARVLASWPCKRSWDYAAMDSITRDGCCLVLNEVFEGDPDGFVRRGNEFFAHMPPPGLDRPLSQYSPLARNGDVVADGDDG